MKTEAERAAALADMTEREIVETLAGREGWMPFSSIAGDYPASMRKIYSTWWVKDGHLDLVCPPYLTSRDALAPALAGLTEDEKCNLHEQLQILWMRDYEAERHVDYTCWLLTLPPATLAAAVAKAIVEAKR